MKALVLSGGGARGAYQAGVLTAVGELALKLKVKHPFKVYTGVSAGAINAGFIASEAEDFYNATQKLAKMWSELHSDQVFKTDAITLGKIGLSWVGELSFGGLSGQGQNHSRSLLDTSPLADLIRSNIHFSEIQENINKDIIHSVAVTALDYKTSESITFIQSKPETEMWTRARRKSKATDLQTEHIVSSSAIPLLFTPGQSEGHYFGDGCVRNQMTLSPAIHLGAKSLFVIGVRKSDTIEGSEHEVGSDVPPSVARVVNVLLNSVLLDGIEVDIERLNRINEFLKQVPAEHHEKLNFRPIDYVWIHPSEDIGAIAASMSSRLPRVIRYLLKGLGPLEDAAEIISYLLFEPDFCKKLIEIGYHDGMAQEKQITEFLLAP
jgi:NTE family protein